MGRRLSEQVVSRSSLSEREKEDQLLQTGYFAQMVERYPFNHDRAVCRDNGSALLHWMEQYSLEIGDADTYAGIFNDEVMALPVESIDSSDREYMSRLWAFVEAKEKELAGVVATMLIGYENGPPRPPSREALQLVQQNRFETIPLEFVRAVAAMIDHQVAAVRADSAGPDLPTPRRVGLSGLIGKSKGSVSNIGWKSDEASRRRNFIKVFKEYIVAYRLWHEMLIENRKIAASETNPSSVERRFPMHTKDREERIIKNRYLRLIETTHDGVIVGQALHHPQPNGRMRTEQHVPYIYHPIAVTGFYLEDVIPFVIENLGNQFDYLLGAFAMPMHDVGEDTSQTVDQALQKLAQIVDTFDSSLDHDDFIKSRYGRTRDEIKKNMLRLLWSDRRKELRRILLTLSKFTILDNGAYARLAQHPFFPKEYIKLLRYEEVKMMSDTNPETMIDPQRFQFPNPKRRTESREEGDQISTPEHMRDANLRQVQLRAIFGSHYIVADEQAPHYLEKFPYRARIENEPTTTDFDDVKMDLFLLRLRAITTGEVQQITLMAKNLDRAHNIATLGTLEEGKLSKEKVIKKRKVLRGTVSRLIAYSVLDHDSAKYPLYNTLPRLIQQTLETYTLFEHDAPSYVEEKDTAYIAQLQQWAVAFPMQPLPPHYEKVIKEYNEAKAKREKPRRIRKDTQKRVHGVTKKTTD